MLLVTMRTPRNIITPIALTAALCLPLTLAQAQPTSGGRPTASADKVLSAATAAASANLATSKVTSPPAGKTAGQSRRAGGDPVDDRVELRSYQFTNTDETLPYAVFVSSKVSKDKKAPLVLALHGMGGNHGTFMRTACVENAEDNGYILVGAMGTAPTGLSAWSSGWTGGVAFQAAPGEWADGAARPPMRLLCYQGPISPAAAG